MQTTIDLNDETTVAYVDALQIQPTIDLNDETTVVYADHPIHNQATIDLNDDTTVVYADTLQNQPTIVHSVIPWQQQQQCCWTTN